MGAIYGSFDSLRVIVRFWNSVIPSSLIVDSFLYVPNTKQKISLNRVKSISLVNDDILISFISLKDNERKEISIPANFLEDSKNLLSCEIILQINNRPPSDVEAVKVDVKNQTSFLHDLIEVFFSVGQLFFVFILFVLAIIMSLWPLWFFVILLILIF